MFNADNQVRKSLYIPEELADRVDSYRSTYGISFNSAVQILLVRALDAEDIQKSMLDFSSIREFLEEKLSELSVKDGLSERKSS